MEISTTPSVGSIDGLKIETTASVDSNLSAILHIYHVGTEKHPRNYSVHTVPDSKTTILVPPKPPKPEKKPRKSFFSLSPTTSNSTTNTTSSKPDTAVIEINELSSPTTTSTTKTELQPLEPVPSIPAKGVKKAQLLDNPKHDPRSETAPYFVHLSKLPGLSPPYTLHRGGTKRSPVTCLLHVSFLTGWTLQFGDVLSKEGVIDGRGVVNPRFGTKDGKDGYFKGYKVTQRRWWGESGKAYWQEQKALGFPDNEHAWEEKVKVEEEVKLKWSSPFSMSTRDHGFEWRGFQFRWKGTRQVESKKAAKPFVWCAHLKLVVILPIVEGTEERDEFGMRLPPKEVGLAKYSCVMGHRKAGRLEIFQEAIDGFLEEYIFKKVKNGSEEEVIGEGVAEDAAEEETSAAGQVGTLDTVPEEKAKTQQRFRDVVVGTTLCMLMSEREKRRFLLELLETVGEFAGG